jgi:hypothetical protein
LLDGKLEMLGSVISSPGPKRPNPDCPLLKVLLSYQLDQAIHRSAARQMVAISAKTEVLPTVQKEVAPVFRTDFPLG